MLSDKEKQDHLDVIGIWFHGAYVYVECMIND